MLFQNSSGSHYGLVSLQIFWADGGYRGSLIHWACLSIGWTLAIVEKLGDQVGFQVLPKRRIVERTT